MSRSQLLSGAARNRTTSLFCFKAGALSTVSYYRKERITWAYGHQIHSFSKLEQNWLCLFWWRWLFRKTVTSWGPQLSGCHRGWTSCSRELPQEAQGTAKHHPLNCFIPFETEMAASAYAVLFCLKFSFLSPLYIEASPLLQGLAVTQVIPKLTWLPAVLNSCHANVHAAAHFGERPTWGGLTLLPTSWVAWMNSVTSLGLHFLIYELGLKYLSHRILWEANNWIKVFITLSTVYIVGF